MHNIHSSVPAPDETFKSPQVEILGARVHNLKNIDVTFPRNALVVITGVSGSGKSSLAFDTLCAEGQRRYMESFSAYARSFIGTLERPEVDKINGLSPVIAIEQKTTAKNPRSTVGTTTEIYDFLRLLFAKIADAYSYISGQKMEKQSEGEIQKHVLKTFTGKIVTLLAPVVKGRKGNYRELLEKISESGYNKVRINGKLQEINAKLQLDRYKTHDIEIVIDRIFVHAEEEERLKASLHNALKQGKGLVMLQDEEGKIHYYSKLLMDLANGLSYDEPAPNTFSFNSPYGACPNCEGLGSITRVDIAAIIPDKSVSIYKGGISVLGAYKNTLIFKQLEALLRSEGFALSTPLQAFPDALLEKILYGDFEIELNDPTVANSRRITQFKGIISRLAAKQEKEAPSKDANTKALTEALIEVACPSCQGQRLKRSSLCFKIAGKNIAELAAMDIKQLYEWLNTLEQHLTKRQQLIATEPLKEIRKRINFLLEVGLNYLHLNRPLRTLSGGEAQRIRLATQIGTQLVGVLYILDEPSIGLHQRDNIRLIEALKKLRDLGNTVVVVEHDKDIMLQADYILDIGPGAGKYGGEVVATGKPAVFLKQSSLTVDYLRGVKKIQLPAFRRIGNGKVITLQGCQGHNLKNVTLTLPLGKMIAITGVSGSGKSTLIHGTLVPILQKRLYSRSKAIPLTYTAITGEEYIDKVIEIDQSPLGRTLRSNPATYTGLFSDIRKLFTLLPEAKIRGYGPGRFSFNVAGGRCPICEGGGMKLIAMNFLPDVYTTCEACKGKRYQDAILEVQYKGKSIADLLAMTISNAIVFFEKHPQMLRKLTTLAEVGLDYLTLGQAATTLSGGEAQRVKLAAELARKDTGSTFYILDEPTTGLHFQDIQHLLEALNKLVDKGNTVLIIEHNMDIIKVADYVIDMGPEGGDQGGQLIVAGTPEEVAHCVDSHTAYFLKQVLADNVAEALP